MDVVEALELPVSVAVASLPEPELDSGFVTVSVAEAVSDSLVVL